MDRRRFLQSAIRLWCRAAAAALPASAIAADTSGYKALVCVFLFGGNDSHNTHRAVHAPPNTTPTRPRAAARRRQNGLALPQGALLPMTGNNFGLHPALTNMATLYNTSRQACRGRQHRRAAGADDAGAVSEQERAVAAATVLPFGHAVALADDATPTTRGHRLGRPHSPIGSARRPRGKSAGLREPRQRRHLHEGRCGVRLPGDAHALPQRGHRHRVAHRRRIPRADVWWNWTGSDPQALFVRQHPSGSRQPDGRAVSRA